jgi:uncharacterized protein YccT (UPF0319 family)
MVMEDSNGATVRFNEELLPLQVNDKVIEHSLFSSVTKLDLVPGRYAVKLQYSDLYELEYDEHEVVESEAFWVELNIMTEGEYLITFERAEEVEEAKLFAKSPIVNIVTPDKNTYKADKNIRLTSQNHDSEWEEEHKPTHRENTVNNLGQAQKQAVTLHSRAPIQNNVHPDAATMLEFWWKQANDEQRATFLLKIKKG